MIERIPRSLLHVNGLFRLPTSASRSCPARFSIQPRPLWSGSLQYLSKRFYASPTPSDPRQAIRQQSQDDVDPVASQLFQHETSAQANSQARQGDHPPPPPPLPPPKRSYKPYIYATIFFLFGAAGGQYVKFVIAPPPLPIPDTPGDESLKASIRTLAQKLPLVKSLTSDPAWRSWEAYSTFTPEEKVHRITTGPLGGARGLGGYHRIFHNSTTGEFISVVWMGGALAGWPGVTHGGIIATLLDESMGRCAIARFRIQTGVTANLDINYLKPTITNAFYVIRSTPIAEGSTERKGFVRGTLEDMNGRVCVEAKGLFVLPKSLMKTPLRSMGSTDPNVGF